MNQNLTGSDHSRLGNANLDAIFSHINALMDNPDLINRIPNEATIIFQADDPWVDAQNELLAEQAIAEGAVVLRVAVGQAEKYESGSKH